MVAILVVRRALRAVFGFGIQLCRTCSHKPTVCNSFYQLNTANCDSAKASEWGCWQMVASVWPLRALGTCMGLLRDPETLHIGIHALHM